MLIDSHCHLDFPEFEGQLPEVVARAKANGVARMITICTNLEEFPKIHAIADQHPEIYCSVGVHPHDADKEHGATVAKILEYTRWPKCVGVGECGLDYYYEHSQRQTQQRIFQIHIEAARASGLPLIVHSRDADQDTIDLLQRGAAVHDTISQGDQKLRGVIHCFTSSRALAEAALDIGFYISLSGIVTFKNAKEIQAVARDIPENRLLVETDAPFLAPVPHRGKTNEPALVRHTAEFIAELRNESFDRLAASTTDNFFRLFDKVPMF